MTKQYPNISPSQLFCVLILSRLSAEAVYPRTASATALEAILAVVIAEAVRFLLALPVIIYSWHGNNIHRAVYSKNKALGGGTDDFQHGAVRDEEPPAARRGVAYLHIRGGICRVFGVYGS